MTRGRGSHLLGRQQRRERFRAGGLPEGLGHRFPNLGLGLPSAYLPGSAGVAAGELPEHLSVRTAVGESGALVGGGLLRAAGWALIGDGARPAPPFLSPPSGTPDPQPH